MKDTKHPLLVLAEELTGVSLLESGTVNPFFLLAKQKEAYRIEVNFSDQQQKEFTTIKIAAFMQHLSCDHYVFVTRIQFPAKAGEKDIMKQQVLIMLAQKLESGYECFANLYDMRLNEKLGRPQLKYQQQLEAFDGQFSNLFDAPEVPDDLLQELTKDIDAYRYQESNLN